MLYLFQKIEFEEFKVNNYFKRIYSQFNNSNKNTFKKIKLMKIMRKMKKMK